MRDNFNMFSDSNLSINDEIIENTSIPEFLSEANISGNISILSNVDKTNDFTDTLDLTDNVFRDSFCESLNNKIFGDKILGDKMRKFKALQNEEQRSRIKYNKIKLVLEEMDEIFDNSNIKLYKTVREKCSKKLKFCNLMKVLNNNVDLLHIINIDKFPDQYSLTNEEKLMIHSGLKDPFLRKINDLNTEYKNMSDIMGYFSQPVFFPGTILSKEKAVVLDVMDKLCENIVLCNEDQIKIINTISNIHSLWESKFQELYEKEMDCLEKKVKLTELKMKNLNYMIENAIVQQDENINNAVEVLHEELSRTFDQIRYSLEKLKTKKKEYENLRGTKFEEILIEYINLRENYKHKYWAVEQIRKTPQ